MDNLIVCVGPEYWNEDRHCRRDIYWNPRSGEIETKEVLYTEKYNLGEARANRAELRMRIQVLLECNVAADNLYGLLHSSVDSFNIYTLCKTINKIEYVDKSRYIVGAEYVCIATYLHIEPYIKYMVACTKNGIIYVDNDYKVSYRNYIANRTMYNKMLDGYLLNYINKSFKNMLADYSISSLSIADLYYDNKLFNFIGKDISELVTYLRKWEVINGIDNLIHKVHRPKIQRFDNGDISFRCEISVLQKERTWAETFELVKGYGATINKLLFESVENNKNFKMLEIPITYFKLDNITFTRDFFIVGVISIKSEIIKQLEAYDKELELEKNYSTTKSSSLLDAINNMTS